MCCSATNAYLQGHLLLSAVLSCFFIRISICCPFFFKHLLQPAWLLSDEYLSPKVRLLTHPFSKPPTIILLTEATICTSCVVLVLNGRCVQKICVWWMQVCLKGRGGGCKSGSVFLHELTVLDVFVTNFCRLFRSRSQNGDHANTYLLHIIV